MKRQFASVRSAILSTRILPLVIPLALPIGSLLAAGTGQTVYPLKENEKMIAAEFLGVVQEEGGIGLQGRYTQKLVEKLNFDFGLSVSGGERSSSFFVGGEYEIFPDYEYQPRFSVRSFYENLKLGGERRHQFKISPTVSKQFDFWDIQGIRMLHFL